MALLARECALAVCRGDTDHRGDTTLLQPREVSLDTLQLFWGVDLTLEIQESPFLSQTPPPF